MKIRDVKKTLEGDVIQTHPRTLNEREMAVVTGGGPRIAPGEGDDGCKTCSYDIINGTAVPGDCAD